MWFRRVQPEAYKPKHGVEGVCWQGLKEITARNTTFTDAKVTREKQEIFAVPAVCQRALQYAASKREWKSLFHCLGAKSHPFSTTSPAWHGHQLRGAAIRGVPFGLHKIGLREASWVAKPCLLLSQAPCRIIPFINTAAAVGEKPGMAKDAECEVL